MSYRALRYLIVFISLSLFLSSCREDTTPQTTGYVEARLFYVSTPQGGTLQDLNVHEGDRVSKGAKLLTLEHQGNINAPASATVVSTYFQEQEYVPPARPILSLLLQNQSAIVFFVPGKSLPRITLGKHIKILFNHQTYAAPITYIGTQAEYTPDAIYNEKNQYNYVYKIKAKLPKSLQSMLKPGQPVNINYE